MKKKSWWSKVNPYHKEEQPESIALSIKNGVVSLSLIGRDCYQEDDLLQQIEIGSISDLSDSIRVLQALNDADVSTDRIFFGVDVSKKRMEASIGSTGMGTKIFLTFEEIFQRIEKKGGEWLNGLSIDPFTPGFFDK